MLNSPPPSQTDRDPHQLLGHLQAAWLSLDYVLRLALIHKRGFALNTVQSERIFARHTIDTIVNNLLTDYSGDDPHLFEKLNTNPDDKIKDLSTRLRLHLHALWAHDPGSGQQILHYLGKANWQNPIAFRNEDVEALIREIHQTTDAFAAFAKLKS